MKTVSLLAATLLAPVFAQSRCDFFAKRTDHKKQDEHHDHHLARRHEHHEHHTTEQRDVEIHNKADFCEETHSHCSGIVGLKIELVNQSGDFLVHDSRSTLSKANGFTSTFIGDQSYPSGLSYSWQSFGEGPFNVTYRYKQGRRQGNGPAQIKYTSFCDGKEDEDEFSGSFNIALR
ncbi:hypothetical protein DSO57_1022968 [Entomophthora muscae]|uniref:Uncharacterized protein n=1 Tax=Entomophthora muscae TaxID=34485 RepID=A0ACC2TPW4_9FUNG|nr:hypothetical protein DSO57_1022968 [Entomophthora muscae]